MKDMPGYLKSGKYTHSPDRTGYRPPPTETGGDRALAGAAGVGATRDRALGKPSDYQAPPKVAPRQPGEVTGGDVAKWGGKKMGAAADWVAGGIKKGTEGIRRGMEDNPAGLAAAGVGAGLGALGLSRLLRRKRNVPA